MRVLVILLCLIAGGAAALSWINYQLAAADIGAINSVHYQQGVFENTQPIAAETGSKLADILYRSLTEERTAAAPVSPLPLTSLTRPQLDALPNKGVFYVKLGHSTVLLKIDGRYWLTDPMFSERASPFNFMGPKRFHAPALSIDALPPLAGVLISHNHYDHLDEASIRQLAAKVAMFYVPLGIKAQLVEWGITADQIQQFDWWQTTTNAQTTLVFTPAHHFSGRALTDRNSTLWGSWVVRTPDAAVYFSGDSGYFEGFAEIGRRYGPFDTVFMESGAYSVDWPQVHMQPVQTVQAFNDVKGRYLVPIHNSTFDLAFHAWYAPLEALEQLSKQQGFALLTPQFGETMSATEPAATTQWWRPYVQSTD